MKEGKAVLGWKEQGQRRKRTGRGEVVTHLGCGTWEGCRFGHPSPRTYTMLAGCGGDPIVKSHITNRQCFCGEGGNEIRQMVNPTAMSSSQLSPTSCSVFSHPYLPEGCHLFN